MTFLDRLLDTIVEVARRNATNLITNKDCGFIRVKSNTVALLHHNGEKWVSLPLSNAKQYTNKLRQNGIFVEKIYADFSNVESASEAIKSMKDSAYYVFDSKQPITLDLLLKVESSAPTISSNEPTAGLENRVLNR